MKTASILAAALALAAPPALAGQPDQAPAAEAKPEKKICRSEKITGSLTRVRRICMTQAEWDELSRNTREGVGDTVRSASGGVSCNPADPSAVCH